VCVSAVHCALCCLYSYGCVCVSSADRSVQFVQLLMCVCQQCIAHCVVCTVVDVCVCACV